MRAYRSIFVAAGAVVLLLAAGCGGGGGGVAPSDWQPYTPPSNVVPPQQQEQFAANQSVDTLGMASTATTDPGQLEFGSAAPLIGGVQYGLGGWGLPFGTTAADAQPTGKTFAYDLARRMRGAMLAGKGAAPNAESDTTPIDWTDPESGIHWTGSLTQSLTSMSLTLHGAGTDTDVDVTCSFNIGLTSATLAAAIHGTISGQVEIIDWGTGETSSQPGKALLDDTLSLEGNVVSETDISFSGQLKLDDTFQLQEGGEWVTQLRQEGTENLEGTLTDTLLEVQGDGYYYFGAMAGDQLFWARHDWTADGQVDIETLDGTFQVTDDVTLSNGMTGHVHVTSAGDIDGWVKDAQGADFATISGNLFNGTGLIDFTDPSMTDIPLDWFTTS